jgi:hypothetical protein
VGGYPATYDAENRLMMGGSSGELFGYDSQNKRVWVETYDPSSGIISTQDV